MADLSTCPDCGHTDTHSPLAGCLNAANGFCPCDRAWTPPKTHADAIAERDDAMAKAERGTDPTWAALARMAVRDLANGGQPFSSDDVWDLLASRDVRHPREPRALGPILKAMAATGTIQVDGFTASRRRHGSPIRTYVGVR